MFSFFWRSKKHTPQWKHDLISVLAKLGTNYNSYYSRIYSFTEFFLKKMIRLNVSTQFFEARVRFKKTSMPVHIWRIELDLLKTLNFNSVQYFGPYSNESTKDVYIYIPEVLLNTFAEIENRLLLAEKSYRRTGRIHRFLGEGTLTSSGRSFWVRAKELPPVCIKIDTFDVRGVAEYLNNRRLAPSDIQLAGHITEYLKPTPLQNFFYEASGLCILASSETYRYTVLDRSLDFERTDVRKGDYLIPMQAILSDEFWQNDGNRKIFGLQKQTLTSLFKDHMVREFARLIKNSIENTFLHFEIHQQNMTLHLRDGQLVKFLIHDLQDVLFDPISYIFSQPDTCWTQAVDFCSTLYRYRFFNLFGEPRLEIAKHLHYFVPSSFYRRYFRNFGNYTRIYNRAANEDYLFSKKLEELVAAELNYSDEDLGVTPEISSQQSFPVVRSNLFWILGRRVEVKQLFLIQQSFGQLKASLKELVKADVEALILRARREVCFYSANIPARSENFPPKKIAHAYAAFRNHIYFLIFADGEMGSVVFIPTL